MQLLGSAPAEPREAEPPAKARAAPWFDWLIGLLSCWLTGGLFLDGWAHNHFGSMETFFTPWHAVLYSGFAAIMTALAVAWLRGLYNRRPLTSAVPKGYELSALGVLLFGIGGMLDLLWHVRFGIEAGTDALLSPTHLLLAASGILIITGPLRAAWRRREARLGWRTGAPAIAAATLTLAALGFFTQFAHPFVTAYASTGDRTSWGLASIYVVGADGSLQTRLTRSGAWNPTWSPDGSLIAYDSNTGGSSQIWTMRPDGGRRVQLTTGPGVHWGPAWSPDGSWLAYTGGFSPSFQVWLVRADGSGAHAIVSDTASSLQPSWSPDGKRLVFASRTPEGWRLETVALDGSGRVRLPVSGLSPAFSPDGGLLAYTSTGTGRARVWVARSDGARAHPLTSIQASSSDPTWSPNGARLAFVSDLEGGQHVSTAALDGSDVRDLGEGSGTWAAGRPAWSPDGARLAYAAGGYPAVSPALNQALGVSAVLIQGACLAGLMLFLLHRWTLPIGTVALVIAGPAAMIAFMRDTFEWVPAAVIVGLAAEVLVRLLRPRGDRPWTLRLVAFAVPTSLYLVYFGTLQITEGIEWSVHLWAGSAVLAGVAGMLLSFLVVGPRQTEESRVPTAPIDRFGREL